MTQVHDDDDASNPTIVSENKTPTVIPLPLPPPTDDPDFPAESFFVSVDEEIDWIDRNAVYDRDDSTKGTTNPKSQHNSSTTNANSSGSQRFSVNLKSLGLPNVTISTRKPCHNTRVDIFSKKKKKKTKSEKESDEVQEPVSPKVSCIGRVRSARGRPAEGLWSCCGGRRRGDVDGHEPLDR